MRKWLLTALMFLPLAAPAQTQPDALPNVSVLADGSLTLPLSVIARHYAESHSGTVSLAFADDQEKDNLLAEGAGADVLITLRTGWLEGLRQQGLIDVYSETPVAGNALALAGPAQAALDVDMSHGFPVAQMLSQMGAEPAFAVPHPEALPEGSYAMAALRHVRIAGDLEPYTLFVKERRQLAALVRDQNAFAVMLATEAEQRHLRIFWRFPAEFYPPLRYRAVVLAGENMKEARHFLEYLSSAPAQAVFAQMGFRS